MKTSIVIPVSNPRMLELCLLSVATQPLALIKEVIVIEDWVYPEYHAAQRICDKFNVTHHRLPTPQTSSTDTRLCECRNTGMKLATGDIVLFLDQDCMLCEGYLDRISEIHSQYDKILFSAERLRLWENVDDFRKANRSDIVNQWKYRLPRRGEPVEWNGKWFEYRHDGYCSGTWGHNMSIQRKNIPLIGDWVNLYGYGFEDQYWDYRAICNGFRCLHIPDGQDIYVCHIDHDMLPLSGEFDHINRLYFFEMHPDLESFISEYNDEHNTWNVDASSAKSIHLREAGIDSLEAFQYLPRVPEILRRYVKGRIAKRQYP